MKVSPLFAPPALDWTDDPAPPPDESLSNPQVMRREAKVMRGEGDTVFAQVKKGDGVEEIKALILAAYEVTKAASSASA